MLVNMLIKHLNIYTHILKKNVIIKGVVFR